jgi:hypothetical protein
VKSYRVDYKDGSSQYAALDEEGVKAWRALDEVKSVKAEEPKPLEPAAGEEQESRRAGSGPMFTA